MSELCPLCKTPISETEIVDCDRDDHTRDCRLYLYLCANGHRLRDEHWNQAQLRARRDAICPVCSRTANSTCNCNIKSYTCEADHKWHIDRVTGEKKLGNGHARDRRRDPHDPEFFFE
jgi:hypothetical protein